MKSFKKTKIALAVGAAIGLTACGEGIEGISFP